MRAKDCMLLAACAAASVAAARADDQLTIAMDRDHLLFVSTTLDAKQLRDLSFGLDPDGIQAFKWINEDALIVLAASAFRLQPATAVTVWVDPQARPLSWPEGWAADSDVLDPAAYLQILLRRAREQAGVRDVLPWQTGVLNLAFPPPIPQKIGSHSHAAPEP